jgi:hypothetical protein
MPSGAMLRSFDIVSLEDEFRRYIKTHGETLFKQGLSVEEISAGAQLFSATVMVTIVAQRHSDLLTRRIDPTRIQNSQAIVLTLGAMCFELSHFLDGQGFNVLVTDSKIGHTVYIKGLKRNRL